MEHQESAWNMQKLLGNTSANKALGIPMRIHRWYLKLLRNQTQIGLKSSPKSLQNRPLNRWKRNLGRFGPLVAPRSALWASDSLGVLHLWGPFWRKWWPSGRILDATGGTNWGPKSHFRAKHVTFSIQNCTMEQWSGKAWKTIGFLAKRSMVWYG